MRGVILDAASLGEDVDLGPVLSLPGRCVVLMPGSDSSGISRKISGEEKRSQLREAMNSIDVPEGIGWIVRTASVDITEAILARDVTYLLRLWDEIKRKGQELEGVGLVYEEQHSILRFLREHFDPLEIVVSPSPSASHSRDPVVSGGNRGRLCVAAPGRRKNQCEPH